MVSVICHTFGCVCDMIHNMTISSLLPISFSYPRTQRKFFTSSVWIHLNWPSPLVCRSYPREGGGASSHHTGDVKAFGSPVEEQAHECGDDHHQAHECGDDHHQAHECGDDHHQAHECGDDHHQAHEWGDDHHQAHECGDDHHQAHECGDDHHQAHECGDDHHQAHECGDDHDEVMMNHNVLCFTTVPWCRVTLSRHTPSQSQDMLVDPIWLLERNQTNNVSVHGYVFSLFIQMPFFIHHPLKHILFVHMSYSVLLFYKGGGLARYEENFSKVYVMHMTTLTAIKLVAAMLS